MFYVKYKDNGIYVRMNSLIFLFFCLSLQDFHVIADAKRGKERAAWRQRGQQMEKLRGNGNSNKSFSRVSGWTNCNL